VLALFFAAPLVEVWVGFFVLELGVFAVLALFATTFDGSTSASERESWRWLIGVQPATVASLQNS
jgi:hypothetical protein